MSLYADNKILCIENPKKIHTKATRTKNMLSKAAWYKINIEKYIAFLYTSNEISKRASK